MSLKVKVLPLAVAQLIAAGAFSGLTATPALAQMGTTPIERITVTGTNIRRVDSETPSEVQVITTEQMIQQGYTSVSDVLRNLTQIATERCRRGSPGHSQPAPAACRCAA